MLLALLGLALLTPSEAAPSIGSIEGLQPAAIGEVLLRGRDHGVIERVAPDHGFGPPGMVKLKLTERPSPISGGCLRKQWTATFYHNPASADGTAIFSDASVTSEVALPTTSGCKKGEFVHVNPGLNIEEALSALGHLQQVRSGAAKVRFSCSDSTGSRLCRTPEFIRQELSRLPAWAVTKRNGNIEFWLGEPGQVVTAVNYSETALGRVRVQRRIPPPV
jgi:hypothetical protein